MTNRSEEQQYVNRVTLQFMGGLTALAHIPALLIYGWARISGALPSEAEWAKNGGNHGPWWDQLQGFVIFLSILGALSLPFTTLLFTIPLCMDEHGWRRRLIVLAKGVGLALIQVLAFVGIFLITFWTVD